MTSLRRAGALGRVGLFIALTILAACGGKQRAPETVREIDRLRARFEAEPDDVDVAARLAEAELFTADGDPRRATAPLSRLASLVPNRADVHHLIGLERMMHGHITEAAESFLAALELAKRSTSLRDVAIVESSIEKLESFAGYVGSAPLIREQLRVHFEEGKEHLGLGAFYRLGDALVDLAYKAGDRAAAIAIAKELGCATEYAVVGPFGPHALLDFEKRFPPEQGEWADAYDLGPLRGTRKVREVETRGCRAYLGNGPYSGDGVTYAKTVFDVPKAGTYLLRVETPNSVMVWLDGEQVAVVDRRTALPPIEWEREVELTPGKHEVRVKVASRHPNPVLSVALREKKPGDVALVQATTPYTRFLRAERLVSRGDVVSARELYREVEHEIGGSALQHYVTIVKSDPLRPDDIRRDKARALIRRLLEQDPDAWYAILEVASLAAAEGRQLEAIRTLREHDDRFPEVYGVVATLRELLLERGFHAEADRLLDKLAAAGPASCSAIEEHLSTALRRDRHDDVARFSAELVQCNAESQAMYSFHVRRKEFDLAEAELERLAALDSRDNQVRYLGSRIYLARAKGDLARATALLEELRAKDPRSSGLVRELFDGEYARGQKRPAFDRIDRALREEPDAMLDLRFLLADLGADDPFEGMKIDGLAEIAAYQKAGVGYSQGAVMVLDYMVTRIFEDRSAMHLVHQIWHINSDEAVNEHGEYSVPDGADLLLLRTVKADGTVLEPDPIGGKATISLPNLARGDFVEAIFQYGTTPSAEMEGAIDGGRFVFENFEVPFHRSEIVYVYPSAIEPTFEARGDLPPPTIEQRDGLVVRRYRVDQRMPPEREAMSVHPFEYLPSVRWAIDYRWDRIIDAVADVLVDTEIADPAHRALAKDIAGSGPAKERAARLYRWVLENVENTEGFTGQAALMLEARAGSQIRVLRYLLGLVDVPSTLLFARTFAADQTPTEIASLDLYEAAVLRIGEGADAVYVTAGGRNIPFGYLPGYVRGAEAFEVKRGGGFVQLPRDGVGDDRRDFTVEAALRPDGSAALTVVEVHTGASARSWRDDLEELPPAELDRIFEQAYASRLFPGAKLEKLVIGDASDVDRPLTIRYELAVPFFGHREGNDWILPVPFTLQLAASLASRPERKTTQIVGEVQSRVTMRVRLPDGASAKALPAVSVKGPSGARFEMRSTLEGPLLTWEREVSIPLMRVPPRAYGELVRFTRAADEAESRPVRVRFR